MGNSVTRRRMGFAAGLSLFFGFVLALPPALAKVGQPVEVWNQAYQENYASDGVDDILTNARNAYVLLDPFTEGLDAKLPSIVARLKANGNQPSAYISIGTGENWRADFARLRPFLVTRQWGEWAGEYFVSIPGEAVVDVMKARIDLIAEWGFEWVEFDNMDWIFDEAYVSDYGIKASMSDGVRYYQTLCAYVHQKGMKCMAKSTIEQADSFDGVTYESYVDDQNWWDQAATHAFLAEGKLVIVVHYDAPDCHKTYVKYLGIYGPDLSFICESRSLHKYTRPPAFGDF